MTDPVKIVPLSKGPAYWTQEAILHGIATTRQNHSAETAKAGHDIKDSYKILETRYS